tara:strand:+ start:257 stop:487 length:231 start_codon:yes stop_codon:yes gene_type:complete
MDIDLSKYEKLIRLGTLTEEYEFAQHELHALLRLQRGGGTAHLREEIITLLDRIAKELSRRRVAADEQAEFVKRLP